MVTSLGNFKIEDAYAPLLNFVHSVGVLTICSTQKKKILQLDGSEIEDEQTTLNFSLDHRYMDGVLIAKVIKSIFKYAENPEPIFKN